MKAEARSKGILLLLFYIILCFLAVPSAHLIPAPQETIQLQKPLQHEVSVALKLVQVYVTDKKGNPVLDLEKEDFALYDNGEQKILTEFEKHVLPLRSAETPVEEPAGLAPIQASPPLLSRKFFKLTFVASKPPPPRIAYQEVLMIAEASAEYFL
jgi:hypothetical protein